MAKTRHGISEEDWTPWVGEKIARAWEAALEIIINADEPSDFKNLIPAMMEAGPLVYRSAQQTLYRAIKSGFLKRTGLYDFETQHGPYVNIDYTLVRTNPEFYNMWSERPAPKKIDKWKRNRALAKRRKNSLSKDYDPLEAKFDV